MGRWHVSNLRRLGLTVSGVVDTMAARADSVARIGGGAPVFGSVDEALAAAVHRSAHVCTPLETHVDLISRLLEAGLHVLAEKPLTESAPETERLVHRAVAVNRLLCPVHQFLFEPGFLALERDVAEFGAIRHIDTVATSAGAELPGSESPDEVMSAILPHPLSLARRLLGASFADAEWTVSGREAGELRCAGVIGGTTIGVLISMSGRPTRNTLRVLGTHGTVHVDLFHGFAVREPPSVSRIRKISRPFGVAASSLAAASRNLVMRSLRREPAYPGLRELISRFYSAVDGSGANPIATEETVSVARARDRILACRAGR